MPPASTAATLAALPLLALLSSPAAAQPRLRAADSAAVVRAAWELSVGGHNERRAVWLWAPAPGDSAHGVALSPAVRAALARRNVPVSTRRPAGDDTVVFRLVDWRADADGILLQVESAWTTVLGSGARRCRTGSGNHERVRVARAAGAWTARWEGPSLHGDRVCLPLP